MPKPRTDEPREIVSVVWSKGDRMVLGYADGSLNRVLATQAIAAELAHEAGLAIAPTHDDTVRWVKEP